MFHEGRIRNWIPAELLQLILLIGSQPNNTTRSHATNSNVLAWYQNHSHDEVIPLTSLHSFQRNRPEVSRPGVEERGLKRKAASPSRLSIACMQDLSSGSWTDHLSWRNIVNHFVLWLFDSFPPHRPIAPNIYIFASGEIWNANRCHYLICTIAISRKD